MAIQSARPLHTLLNVKASLWSHDMMKNRISSEKILIQPVVTHKNMVIMCNIAPGARLETNKKER